MTAARGDLGFAEQKFKGDKHEREKQCEKSGKIMLIKNLVLLSFLLVIP